MNRTKTKPTPGRLANRVFPKPDPNERRVMLYLAVMELIPELPYVDRGYFVTDENGLGTAPVFETNLLNDIAITIKERVPRQFHEKLEELGFWNAYKEGRVAGLLRWCADLAESLDE